MTTGQVSYIRGIELGMIGDKVKSSSDRVIDYLTEQGHDFIYLGHRDVSNTRREASSRDVSSLASGKDSMRDVPSLARKDMSPLYCGYSCESSQKTLEHSIPTRKEPEMLDYAESHRRAYMLTEDQHLFMGITWVLKEERRALDLCPEVIFVDGTMHTNNEKCPLFTVTGKIGLVICLL